MLKEVIEIGYIWSDEVASLLCSDQTPLEPRGPISSRALGSGPARELSTTLGALSIDTGHVRYSLPLPQ